MNKIFILSAVLLVSICTAVFVSAVFRGTYTESNNHVVYNIEKAGWYLIPFGFDLQGCKNFEKAGWVWSPTLNKYLGGSDFNRFEGLQEDLKKFESDANSKYLYASAKGGGAWIYISGSCKLEDYLNAGSLDKPEVRDLFNQFKLARGWNFMTLVPQFIGKSLKDIAPRCVISKAAEWDADTQEFIIPSDINGALSAKFGPKDVGDVLLIKVADTCNLGLSSSGTSSPPALPDLNSNTLSNTLNSDFPKTIGEFVLKSQNPNDKNDCVKLDDVNLVCVQMSRIQYLTSTNRRVDVLPTKISSGKSSYVSYIKKYALEKNVDGVPNVYRGNEPWELYWFTNNGYDAIAIQDYQITPNPDGTSTSAQRLNATTTNSVVKWLLNKYPPVAA